MEPSRFLSKDRIKSCPVHRAFYQGSHKSALAFKLANIQEFVLHLKIKYSSFNLCKLICGWGMNLLFGEILHAFVSEMFLV